MILTGSQTQPGQQVLITSSQNEIQPAQTIKFLSSNVSSQNITSPTKTITLAQAQQMGLLTTNKVQHILPSTPQKQVYIIFSCYKNVKLFNSHMIIFSYHLKGIIVNKMVQSSSAQSSTMTIVPSSAVKSPTKILPAPIINSQVKPPTIPNQQSVFSSSSKTNVQPSPQKVIIRQVIFCKFI